jgi:hypothetical protein
MSMLADFISNKEDRELCGHMLGKVLVFLTRAQK